MEAGYAHAQNFLSATFPEPITTSADMATFRAKFLPEGYRARRPNPGERLNSQIEGQLFLSLRHFELGLRLPFPPEYLSILRRFGAVPSQLHPNLVSTTMTYIAYPRSEGIAFDLAVFQCIYPIGATDRSVLFGSSHHCRITGTLTKVHCWDERLVVVSGDLSEMELAPRQPDHAVFSPPTLTGDQELLFNFFMEREFNVIVSQQRVSELPIVAPGEGMPLISPTRLLDTDGV